jgi:two-component system nitrate/nitrite response regulator NarL
MFQVSAQSIAAPDSLANDATSSQVRHRVIVLDAHPIAREGLRAVLTQHSKLDIIATIGHPTELEHHQDVVPFELAVISMGEDREQGLLRIRDLRERCPGLKVVAICQPETAQLAERCLLAGAAGWVSQTAPVETLHAAIDDVLAGRFGSFSPNTHLSRTEENPSNESPTSPAMPLSTQSLPPSHDALSRRERELFMYLGSGRTTREIANLLGLSVKTVATHRINIQAKLGLRNRAALAREAVLWTTATGWQASPLPSSPNPGNTPQA